MAEERAQRRLAAILAADVVGYSRLMERDESGTLGALKARRREVIDPLVAEHQGRIVKVMGDGVLVEFASAVHAVSCAIELQKAMAAANGNLPEDRRIVLRIGVNLGDVMVEGSDLYGEDVNIAARLEALAEPGGILVSGSVHDHVKNKIDAAFDDLGPQSLKNIAEPRRAYRLADRPRGTMAAPGKPSAKPSIAVLPFTNMSGDPEQQYFSDGMTEDIITELSRFRQLHVLARNSSFRYRGSDIDVIRVGRELGVQYLVEGSVRRLGERIRITAQLVDAGSGHHLWAERFDRDQEEVFAVQDRVVQTIVGTLVGRLEAAGAERARRKPPASLAAHECVLRANALPHDDPQAEAEACRLFEQAIELDPGYARAYALLAAALCDEWLQDMSEADSTLERAFLLAKQAIALDENDSVCQSALGLIHLLRGSYELAEHHYRKALELNPNRPMAMAGLGVLCTYLGNSEEAIGRFNDAKLLDPFFDPTWYWPDLAVAHFTARRYDEAIAALDRSPHMPYSVHAYLAACHALTGRSDRAGHHAAAVLHLVPDFSLTRFAAKEPFRRPADRQHLLDGLRKAGLPE